MNVDNRGDEYYLAGDVVGDVRGEMYATFYEEERSPEQKATDDIMMGASVIANVIYKGFSLVAQAIRMGKDQ